MLSPGPRTKDILAAHNISKVPPESVYGMPPPPISFGRDIEAHPALVNFSYASLNPGGIITSPSLNVAP